MSKIIKSKYVKPNIVKTMYQMAVDIHHILRNNEVLYWMIGGTFLGAIRHKGLIPWDDDIDFGVLSSQIRYIKSINWKKYGFYLVPVWFGFKVCLRKNRRKPIPGHKWSYPFVDLFTHKKEDGRLVFSRKHARDTWPKEYFSMGKNGTLDLKLYPFGSVSLWGFANKKNREIYFRRVYGKKWNEEVRIWYDHENEEEIEEIKVKLTSRMRHPAKPTTVKTKRYHKNNRKRKKSSRKKSNRKKSSRKRKKSSRKKRKHVK